MSLNTESLQIDPPNKNEFPSDYSDRLGRIYANNSVEDHKKAYGQYLTPVPVAKFMAEMIRIDENREDITILDPGIGSAVLTCAACESIINKNKNLKRIKIVGYEVDLAFLKRTKNALDYLKRWLTKQNVKLEYSLKTEDFILSNAAVLEDSPSLFNLNMDKFDVIISNPPYFKINKNDPRAIAASKVVYGQPNIYALFMAISAYLLNEMGQLVFITPRSFSSGQYFKAFREIFFGKILPITLHLYGSRKNAFIRDEVLQEHLIVHGISKIKPHSNKMHRITISFSQGTQDRPVKRIALLKDVINFDSENKVMFLPLSDEEENIISLVNSWKGNLHKYGIEISTGKVVPFRAIYMLRNDGDPQNSAPLIWMNHIKKGQVVWPLEGFRKQEFILVGDFSEFLLIPNQNCVLMRRFSAKEEEQRLNTAPFLKSQLNFKWLGLENHVNYIYRPKGELTADETVGLSAVLNSKFLDVYFRSSNGNTEVSATEVRDMPLPDHQVICKIGNLILNKGNKEVNIESILKKTK